MIKLFNKIYFKGLQMKSELKKMWENESGEGNLLSVILILAIVLTLAIIFRGKLQQLLDTIWGSMFGSDRIDKLK